VGLIAIYSINYGHNGLHMVPRLHSPFQPFATFCDRRLKINSIDSPILLDYPYDIIVLHIRILGVVVRIGVFEM
jgi:hypothetical protein